MSLTAAQRVLPVKNEWKAESGLGSLVYCSSVDGDSCGGDLELDVISACTIIATVQTACTHTGPLGSVAEIDLFANGGQVNQFVNPETWDVVTLRGIHLGSRLAQVERRYRITGKGHNAECAIAGTGGPTLTAVAGENTIVFTIEDRSVYGISLFAGRQPAACTH